MRTTKSILLIISICSSLAIENRPVVELSGSDPEDLLKSSPLLSTSSAGFSEGPAISTRGFGLLDLFARGVDNGLWYKYYQGGWSGWFNLGGTNTLTSSPSSVSWSSNRIDVVARRIDGAIWQKTYSGFWSSWISLGAPSVGASSGPAICSYGPNRLDIFVRGGNDHLYQKTYTGTWGPWIDIGGFLTSEPACVAKMNSTTKRIDVVVRGNNLLMYINTNINGSWIGWSQVGGTDSLTSGPGISSRSINTLDLFARGTNNQLLHNKYNGSWSGWTSLGGFLTSSPDAVSWSSNRIDVVYRGSNLNIQQVYYNGVNWYGYFNLGGQFA
jgi:hypothetical protein